MEKAMKKQIPTDFIQKHAKDILCSHGMQLEKKFLQHGCVTCYDHSLSVAHLSVALALRFRIKVNMRSMIRGALLHDYFLYDWHQADKSHRPHGFLHARHALKNAQRDFHLSSIEEDVILKHMFPLNLCLPRYRETVIVTVADKICAIREVWSAFVFKTQ